MYEENKQKEATIVQTQNSGFLVSISRSIKIGKTATEMTNIRMEGYAKDQQEALQTLKVIDEKTLDFIKKEAELYKISLNQSAYIGAELPK